MKWNCLFGLFIFLSLLACKDNTNERMAVAIQQKVDKYRIKKEKECRASLLDLAEQRVDSMLLADALRNGLDTLTVQNRRRPYMPEKIAAWDSIEVKPLFSDSIADE